MLNPGDVVRYFPSGSSTSPGAFSYITSRFSNWPQYSGNQNVESNHTWNPRNQFNDLNFCFVFNTYLPILPYLIIDVGKYRIKPSSYAIIFERGYTPPTEWIIRGSNTGNINEESEWTDLAHFQHNTSVCPNGSGDLRPELCNERVFYQFPFDLLNDETKTYRYFQLKYLKTRNLDYYNQGTLAYFRLMRFEIFGIMSGYTKCKTLKKPLYLKKNLIFLMCIIMK